MTSRRERDRLAAEARRWLGWHRGPQTAATKAVREALGSYYAEADLDSIGRFQRWGVLKRELEAGAIAGTRVG